MKEIFSLLSFPWLFPILACSESTDESSCWFPVNLLPSEYTQYLWEGPAYTHPPPPSLTFDQMDRMDCADKASPKLQLDLLRWSMLQYTAGCVSWRKENMNQSLMGPLLLVTLPCLNQQSFSGFLSVCAACSDAMCDTLCSKCIQSNMNGLTEQSMAVSCPVSTTQLNNIAMLLLQIYSKAKAAPVRCCLTYSSCQGNGTWLYMYAAYNHLTMPVIYDPIPHPKGDFEFDLYISGWKHPAGILTSEAHIQFINWWMKMWEMKFLFSAPPAWYFEAALSRDGVEWQGEFSSCNYSQQSLVHTPNFSLLMRFYGSFRAGMQSLVISFYLIGHLQDGFWVSTSS